MPEGRATARVTISITEAPHFGRLVEFMSDVERYAHETDDYTLDAIVRECRDDLMVLCREEDG